MFLRTFLALSACASSLAVAQLASAQAVEQPVTQSAPEASNAIDDIIVTARRRSETLQSVPVAITALSSETLREKAIATPYDLTASTPGIAATAGSATRNDVQYFIRGQGTTYGSSPSVVTYFAEVPQLTFAATGGSNITFFDLESAQVLKGPQGTLFGRSTTAGAVLLTPKKPTGEFDGFLEVGLGNYNMRDITGAIDIPLIGDKLAVRIAGNYSAHDGYSRSSTLGQELDDRNRFAYRVTLLARPTDWLTNTTIFSDMNIDENGTALTLTGYEPLGLARQVYDSRLGAGFELTGSLLDTRPGGIYDPTGSIPAEFGGVTDIAQAGGLGFIYVNGICNGINAPGSPAAAACVTERLGRINATAASLAGEQARISAGGDPRSMVTTLPQFTRMRIQQFINTTELDLGELGFLGETTFKNIFSTTRRLNAAAVREIQDGLGTGIAYNGVNVINNNCTATVCTGNFTPVENNSSRDDWFDEWSEEAQLSGRINGKHDWIIGYFTEQSNQNFYMNVPSVFQVVDGALSTPQSGLPSVSSGYADPYKASQTGYFGQTTIDFSDFGMDGLRFTAGYRHSIVKQSTRAIGAIIDPVVGLVRNPNDVTIADLKQTADSYTFSLDYKVRPGMLVYAATRKGFKQGGINFQAVQFSGTPGALPYFAPETVTDYELGLKTDYELGNIGLRTNIAVFQADYSGLHRNSTFFNGTGVSTQIVNAAKMRTRGLELEQIFRFTPEFTVNVNYAYLDAKFLSFPGGTIRPGDGMVIDNIKTPISGAPKHKLDVTARYAYDAGETGEFVLSGNVGYQSRTNQDDGALSVLRPTTQAPYALANLRLDWNNVMGNPIDIALFGKNVTNKLYRLATSSLINSGLGNEAAIYGDPATYGVQVRVRFGRSGER